MIDGPWHSPFGFYTFILLYPPTIIELIGGLSMVLCTWVVIIGLVNTIYGVPTTPLFTTNSLELLFKLLPTKNSPNPQSKLIANPITTPFLATFVLGSTTMSIHVVVITALNDWVTSIPVSCFHVSIITLLTLLVKLCWL